MNLYVVVSEDRREMVWEDWFNNVGHEECYRIVALVMASKPSQARYLAWKADKTFTPDITEMPRFSCRIKGQFPGVDIPSIVTNDEQYQHYWDDKDEVEMASRPPTRESLPLCLPSER